MDDRFRNEENSSVSQSENNDGLNNYSAKSNSLGDFSVNINSESKGANPPAGTTGAMPQKAKKFEVHLPDSVDYIPDFSTLTSNEKKPEKSATESTIAFVPVSGKDYVNMLNSRKSTEGNGTSGKNADVISSSAQSAPRERAEAAVKPQQKVNKASDKKAAENNKKAKPSKPQLRKASAENKKDPKKAVPKKEKEKINPARTIIVTCICLVFITLITVSASTVALATINDILAISQKDKGSVTVTIPEGARYEQVFDILEENELIKQPFITDLFCKFRNYDEVDVYDKTTKSYKTVIIEYVAGVYYLDKDMGIENMLETIMLSSSGNKDSVKLTFPEGWSIAKIFAKLEKYDVCEAEKLYANLETVAKQYSFMKGIDNGAGRYLLAEGYLFPDTYDFYIGENASSVLKKLFNNFDSKWTEEYTNRLKELDMTIDEVITIASIIQREARDASQMEVISSVIHNRLKESATYPTLDMNSTKDYIISIQKDNEIFSEFYYNLYLNSYNTYSNQGLPPGPICNPGIDAIKAALYPADTDYNFFCHSKSGEMYLAVTVSEHQANAAKVLAEN